MRFTGGQLVNVIAWAILIAPIPIVMIVAMALGPFGLIILGVATLLLCTSAQLNGDTPSAGSAAGRMARAASPEPRAAEHHDRQSRLSPLTFYRGCGAVLLAAGVAGFVWERLQ